MHSGTKKKKESDLNQSTIPKSIRHVAAEPSFVSILSRIDSVKLIISRLLFSPRQLEGLKMAKLELQAIENMVQFKIDKLEESIYGKDKAN